MKVLLLLLGLLWVVSAAAQGTFTYTFSGDNSPLNVWATFQVSEQAVATGSLSTADIISGYMLQGGKTWDIFYLEMPVDPRYAYPNGSDANTQLAATYPYDEIDIFGGIMVSPYTEIVYYPRLGSPSMWSRTTGKWTVTYAASVPEPSTVALFMVGLGALFYRYRSGRSLQNRPELK